MPEPAAGVMRMSADDDDQADQRHELADPGTAETDRSVLEKFFVAFQSSSMTKEWWQLVNCSITFRTLIYYSTYLHVLSSGGSKNFAKGREDN